MYDFTIFDCYFRSGILVLKYALMLQDKAMFQVNLAAIILNSLYLLCYFIYSRNTWEEIYRPCLRGFGLIAALFTYMAWEDPSKVEYRYGLIVTILMLLLMGAPLREVVCKLYNTMPKIMQFFVEGDSGQKRCFEYTFSDCICRIICIGLMVFVWNNFAE